MNTNLSRRGFLGGILALGAAPAIIKAESLMKLYVPPKLILWGDGIHDDTRALQAAINGEEVIVKDMASTILVTPKRIRIRDGNYLISDTVYINATDRFLDFSYNTIIADPYMNKDKLCVLANRNTNSSTYSVNRAFRPVVYHG